MGRFDYDVLIVGSAFGGCVAALRAAEKGYRVGVMESGRRWNDAAVPTTNWNLPTFLWHPAAEMYGMQRLEYLDDVLVLCGAGVGGGSHIYGNTLHVPPKQFFNAAGWSGIADWADELAPCIDQASRMLGVVRYPYMPTDVDRYMQQVAIEMGRGESFNKAPVGVYFGQPGVEADDPYVGGVGPRRGQPAGGAAIRGGEQDRLRPLHRWDSHWREQRTRRGRSLPTRVRSARSSRDGWERDAGQPGVNPSLLITALVERAMSFWPNKGEANTRPPLGSGYEHIQPVTPLRPAVPAGALGELRLDAKKSDIIPEYPY